MSWCLCDSVLMFLLGCAVGFELTQMLLAFILSKGVGNGDF